MVFRTFYDIPGIVSYPQPKNEWGKSYWNTMFNMASTYPDKPNRAKKKEMRETLTGIINNLPCISCKEHARDYIKKHKINVKSRAELIKYICDFKNHVNRLEGKPEFDCSSIHVDGECLTCKVRTYPDTTDYSEYKQSIRNIVKQRCKEAGVSEPNLVFGACPTDKMNSCTQVDMNSKKGTMYINGNEASLRTVEHEIEHWVRSQKGDTDAGNEDSVDERAKSLVNSHFHDNNLNSQSSINSNVVTMADTSEHKGGIFSHIDGFYKPLSELTGVKAEDLNDANTPEIIGYGINAVQDMTLTPFGQLLTNMVSGLGIFGLSIMMKDQIPVRDRKFLAELGAHQFWSIIRFANPNTNRSAHIGAAQAGQAFAAGDIQGLIKSVIQTPTPAMPVGAPSKAAGVNTPKNVKPVTGAKTINSYEFSMG